MSTATLQMLLKAVDQASAVLVQVDKDLGVLKNQVAAVEAQASKSWANVGKTLESTGRNIRNAGFALTELTAPAMLAGAAAVKMSLDFEESLTHMVTLVGLSRDEVNAFKEDILALAPEVAKSPKELADALYFITSSGLSGQTALNALTAAAKASAMGMGETTVIADALTSAMNAYGPSVLSAEQATAILLATVREGKGEADELAGAIGKVIPIAAQMGISFHQVGAAMSSMTLLGLDADEAATALRQTMVTLLKPSSEAEAVLKDFGLSAAGLRQQVREQGLLEVLQTLAATVATNDAAMAKIFPNVRALTGVLNLLGANTAQAEEIFAKLAATTAEDLNTAFASWEETAGAQFKQVIADMQVQLIRLGDILVPILADRVLPIVDHVVDAVEKLVTVFEDLPAPVQYGVLAFVGLLAVLGPLLTGLGLMVMALGALAPVAGVAAGAMAIFWTAATGPVGLVIAGLVAVGAAAFLLWKNWDTVWEGMKAAPGWLRDHIKEVLLHIVAFFSPVGIIALIVHYWGQIFEHMPEPVQRAMNLVAGIVQWVVRRILEFFAVVLDKLADIVDRAGDAGEALKDLPGGDLILGGAVDKINDVAQSLYGLAAQARQTAADLSLTLNIPTSTMTRAEALAKIREVEARQYARKKQPEEEEFGGYEPPPTGGGGPSQAALDLLALAAAFDAFHAATQGTLEDFLVLLKVVEDRRDIDRRLAEAQVSLRVAEIHAADAAYQLKSAFVELAEDAVRSGRTMNQELANLFGQLLSKWERQFNDIINRPTRESSALQLQIDQLKLQRDLLIRGGATTTHAEGETASAADRQLEALNEQIAALEMEQRIRQDQLAILKDQNELLLARNFTDRDLIAQIGLTVLAEEQAMQGLQQFGLIAVQESFNVRSLGDAAAWTAEQLRVIGYLQGPAVASYAAGITYIPRDMLAMVHQGERIVPADENMALLSGRTGGSAAPAAVVYNVQIENHITADGDISDAQIRKLARVIRQEQEAALSWARAGGSQPPAGAFS